MLVGQTKNKTFDEKIAVPAHKFLQFAVHNRVWSSLHNYRLQVDPTALTLELRHVMHNAL